MPSLLRIIFIIIAFASLFSGIAQTPSYIHFTPEWGLPSRQVYSTMRDSVGYIWVCTNRGVAKFDGYDFSVYSVEHGLPSHDIWGAFQDEEGKIWLSTYNEVLYFKDGQFHRCYKGSMEEFMIHRYYERAGSGLYFTTDKESGNLYEVIADTVRPTGLFEHEKVIGIARNHEQDTYVATIVDGIALYKKSLDSLTLELQLKSQKPFIQRAVWFDSKWCFFTQDSLYTYDFMNVRSVNLSDVLKQDLILDRLILVSEHKLGLVTSKGTFMVDREFNLIPEMAFLNDLNCNFIREDSYQNVWVSTTDGLYLLPSGNISSNQIYLPQTPTQNSCTKLAHDFNHRIWVGTKSGELFILDGQELVSCFDFQDQFGGRNIRAIHFVSNRRMLIGGDFGFAVLSNRASDKHIWHADRFFPGNFKHISQSHSGKIFVSAAEGVYLFDTLHNALDTIYKGRVYATAFDAENARLAIGKKDGLFIKHQDSLNARPTFHKQLDKPVNDIHLDASGRLWVATDGYGIYVLDKNLRQRVFLENKIVKSIIEDENGRLWAITPDELIKYTFTGKEPKQPDFQLVNLERYTAAREFNDISLVDGKIILTTGRGVKLFHADLLLTQRGQPNLHISKVTVNGKDLELRQNYELKHDQNQIQIHYVGISYQSLGAIKYRTKLEGKGIQTEWEETEVRYKELFGLQPGTYTFRISATNSSMDTPLEEKITFKILPPWYGQLWAQTLAGILIFCLLAFVFRIAMARKARQLEYQNLKEIDIIKSRFYTYLTHEFQSPLSIIKGISEELLFKPNSAPYDSIALINHNADYLSGLVKQLLDLRKLEVAEMEVNQVYGDVVSYLGYLIDSLQALAVKKQITLQLIAPESGIPMWYDPEKVNIIIRNLISNAIKFTPPGGKIEAIAEQKDQQLILQVRDNGIGIEEEAVSKIFGFFQQPDHRGIAQMPGYGIGLSLVRELMRLLQGTIAVESTPGKGATFILKFPVEDKMSASPVLPLQFEKPELAAKGAVPGKATIPTLLIVEDNEHVAELLTLVLQTDYHIIRAANGLEGLEAARLSIPEIVISDVLMPEKDGFWLCTELKKDPLTDHIPVVLLTGLGEDSKTYGWKSGADAFIAKPFLPTELRARIEQLLLSQVRLREKYRRESYVEELVQRLHSKELSPRPDEEFLVNTMKIIVDNLSDSQFDVETLARELNLSRSQLFRKFNSLLQQPPKTFILSIRLTTAKKMVLETQKPIKQIAYETGFSSPNFFARQFRKSFGKSPSAFRKSGGENL
jgi:signal transduction histidine kinase/DNA-binding response OmpR family regulator/ligand-binding sensor domain-containing protein